MLTIHIFIAVFTTARHTYTVHPEVDKSSPRCTILFFKANFNIILAYFSGSVYNRNWDNCIIICTGTI